MSLLEGMADEVDEAFDTIGKFADLARRAGIRGYIAEQANDPDFAVPVREPPECLGRCSRDAGLAVERTAKITPRLT